MFASNAPPARLARSTASKGNGYFSEEKRRDREEKPKEKPSFPISLVRLVTELGWSFAVVDEALHKRFLEIFFKAGKPYLRIK